MGILGYGYKASKLPKTIKSVKIANRLTERRKNTDDLLKIRSQFGNKPSSTNKVLASVKSTSAANDQYDKAVKARKIKIKKDQTKGITAALATGVGGATAHGVAKKKFPKYKKFMEEDPFKKKKNKWEKNIIQDN